MMAVGYEEDSFSAVTQLHKMEAKTMKLVHYNYFDLSM